MHNPHGQFLGLFLRCSSNHFRHLPPEIVPDLQIFMVFLSRLYANPFIDFYLGAVCLGKALIQEDLFQLPLCIVSSQWEKPAHAGPVVMYAAALFF